MSPDEVTFLLTRIQGFDNRDVSPGTVTNWVKIMSDVPYALACRAVEQHFARSTEYLMPAHVINGARAIALADRRDRAAQVQTAMSEEIHHRAIERSRELAEPPPDPDEIERYGQGLLHAIMGAVTKIPRDRVGMVPKGEGVAAARAAVLTYQARNGRAPNVEPRRVSCRNALCVCTHDEPCEAGWMAVDTSDPAARVDPCPVCHPKAATIVTNAKGNRELAMQLLREQGKEEATKGRADEWM